MQCHLLESAVLSGDRFAARAECEHWRLKGSKDRQPSGFRFRQNI
jgi:hypothetical protein